MIPIAGSAYTYSYATLGEIFAWIIGWDLILEYVVSNVVVAIGFSAYTKSQLASFGLNLPDHWSTPVWESGHWTGSYFNIPAFLIIFILTVLLVRGVRESAEANNVMVAIKIGAILIFLMVGGALVNPSNWRPFAPSGFGGIVTGGAIVFFTYIGFDSVSTAAEEARNPQRDLPIGIIGSLDRLYDSLHRRLDRSAGHDEIYDLRFRRRRAGPGGLCFADVGREPLVAFHHRDWRVDGNDFVPARVSVRSSPHLVRHVA